MTAQQLKNSILQTAVRGKLVPQDPDDEPASVLLERIRSEKERMVKEGKIKKEKNPSTIFRGTDNKFYEKIGNGEPVCIQDKIPFDIPDSWEWVRSKELCIEIFSGRSPKYEKVASEYRIIGQAANQQGGINYGEIKYTNLAFWESMPKKYFLKEYDVLLNTLGNGTLGRSGIIKSLPFEMLTDGHLFIFRHLCPTLGMYFYYFLQNIQNKIIKAANGSTNQAFLSLNEAMGWLIPLPPLSEQKRIVAKLNEVLPYLDRYDEQSDALSSLDGNFPSKLRNSILQTAVQGKLVPQDSDDEPASVLLGRIRSEKERMVKEGKIKREKNPSTIFRGSDNKFYEKIGNGEPVCIQDKIPFDIPDSWEWARFDGLAINYDCERRPVSKSERKTEHGYYDYYGATGVIDKVDDYLFDGEYLMIGEDGGNFFTDRDNSFIANGKFWANNHVHIVQPLLVDIWYLKYVLDSFNLAAMGLINGIAVPKLNQQHLNSILVPVPPISEQVRIVAKVNEAFSILDKYCWNA